MFNHNIWLKKLMHYHMLLCLPLWQQPHASSTEDVERRLLVLVLWDVSSREAEERVEVVTGLRWGLGQGGDT